MKVLKFDGELYRCCNPRRVNLKYTCDAWRERTGKLVKDPRILAALGEMSIRGK